MRSRLLESPRLSVFLVFLLSGALCYGFSCLTKWLPGADGRFTAAQRQRQNASLLGTPGDEALKLSNAQLPKRPRRLSLPILILAIVLRLEIFHRVNYQQQCSTPGIEVRRDLHPRSIPRLTRPSQSFLCILLFAYEIFNNRRKWAFLIPDDPDDPWRSCFDDIWDWFSGPRVVLTMAITGALTLATGTYKAVSQITPSTYYCLELIESRRSTLLLQTVGLTLDALIIVLLWRTLAWCRTAKLRLRILGSTLLLSSLSMGLVWTGHRVWTGSRVLHAGFGSLYGFDIIVDGFVFAILMISTTFWVCETSPLTPASIITFLVGTVNSCENIFRYGDYLHPYRLPSLLPLWIVAFGMVAFTYSHDIRSIIFIRRSHLATLLFGLLVGAAIFINILKPQTFNDRHPISDLINRAHIEQDRWLRKVSVSQSLPVAVDQYKKRHDGRNPPPSFDIWYSLAKDTVVTDHFDQIEKDLSPFRAVPPRSLRKRTMLMAEAPDIHTIVIKNGQATSSEGSSDDLDGLVAMINKFAKYLPDLVLPINLSPTPRVLPTWEVAHGQGRADLTPLANLITKRTPNDSNETVDFLNEEVQPSSLGAHSFIAPSDYLQMQIEACAPGSRIRTKPHWNFGEFCASCVRCHSKGPMLVNWERSLQFCAQPDLKYLHGMTLSSPSVDPTRDLLPLFGPSKTEPFRDIIIPIPMVKEEKVDMKWDFARRYDAMVWRGETGDGFLSNQAIRGGHKYRLLHLTHAQHPKEISMLLTAGNGSRKFHYEKVPAVEANAFMSLSLEMDNYTGCLGPNCALARQAYGLHDEVQEPLEYRYVLLLDNDAGPSPSVLRTVRSHSVPFVSTIFRQWYTDRLIPWLHFVPIDIRYQGLHTTLSYFTGTPKNSTLNGRPVELEPQGRDGRWIAQEGAKWAKKALGEKDMEVYLFRLLLEWGRLLDDKREEIGFSKDSSGEFQSFPWTKE